MSFSEPMELIDLTDGQSISFHVLSFEQDQITIKPAHAPDGKVVTALRMHVPPTDKPHFPFYHDATSKNLVAQLGPLLPSIVEGKRMVTITKRGVPPKARFTVEVR